MLSGGVSNVLREGILAGAFDKPFWLQLVGTGLTTALAAHLGAVLPMAQWPAITCLNNYSDDLLVEPLTISGGHLRVPEGPGLGIEIDEEALSRFRMEPPYEITYPRQVLSVVWPGGRVMHYAHMQQCWADFLAGNQPVQERGVRHRMDAGRRLPHLGRALRARGAGAGAGPAVAGEPTPNPSRTRRGHEGRKVIDLINEDGLVGVVIESEQGAIEVELDAAHAPITVANFLRYVDGGYYDGGQFHRTVTMENQPNDTVRIEVIQAGVNPDRAEERFEPIPLERTTLSGLLHQDGAISMARRTPDSAVSDFFICIGDQPSLDFGGPRNPDGQGFAAFGRVVRGMDVVRTIQSAPAEGQKMTPPVRILSLRRRP